LGQAADRKTARGISDRHAETGHETNVRVREPVAVARTDYTTDQVSTVSGRRRPGSLGQPAFPSEG
jgi:hypothetical protein